ncbi:hypothetical protein GLOTRDRAFT_105293 [Gloeophyllum trabeum ATCC 11539]|uniref:Formin binding protein n=1 Tax=Gloeophyllum trabeum (strain ATCC 11539 / FP-39264 / Madison 617) TaxID=670483 RepID=S7RUD0_GLOTA|nr:uncharacterized protein GLOTRDRAFT_105293 [Gloeophyllum trabeum ATCC 11539]EPQ56799.1 hypothetical protein GLOTRDRAFT_105293 [Gloeophyllum trabeum ATCC 11539]
MSSWTEHRNPEGRTYWFNAVTKESVWEKPDELKSPFERALNQTKWKEYFSSGRKYYYNTETKESKWDMPDELLLLLEKVEKEPKQQQQLVPASGAGAPVQGALVHNGGSDLSLTANNVQPPLNGTNGAVGLHTGQLPFQAPSALPARPNLPEDPVIPHNGFATYEEGEKAFMHLLRKAGVDANWTWDQTMRTIITDPLYKALNTLAEKKAAWQKYTDALRAKEQEEREARLSKLRPAIRNMLKGNPLVFHYTTFATADRLFAQHPIWQQAKIEAERKLIFEEYVAELKQREVQETRAARARSISKVVSLFKQLDVDVLTRWRTAHAMVLESDEWKNDPELQKLPTLDILLAFEDYSRVREREFEEQMRRNQVEKTRRERKAREGFKALLKELADSGKIKARTKWKSIYPLFSSDERYLNMLGKPGSNPLELFWDVVDALDQKLDAKVLIAEGAITRHNAKVSSSTENPNAETDDKSKSFVVTPNATLEEFVAVVKGEEDDDVRSLSNEDLEEIFKTLRDQAVKKQEDERRRAERKQRHLQDDLRYALRKLPEPIDLNMSYEEAVPLMENLPEYKALEDEGRRAAFAKFIKRQKERLRDKEASEDGGSTTSRKRKEPSSRDHREERDKDEERDRKREREREPHREREKEHEPRGSRHHHRGYDDYEHGSHRSSRDYRDRDRERERDYGKDKDKDREYYRSSKHYREQELDRERDGKRKDRRGSYSGGREWEEAPGHATAYEGGAPRPYRERSTSVYREEPKDKRERSVYDDKDIGERAEKRARHEPEIAPNGIEQAPPPAPQREETPEEGEI